MKLVRQFLLILAVSLVGELLKALLPLPVPASVYGLALMLLCLCAGWIKVEQVDKAADFLIEIMPIMFIPAAVGLTEAWGSLQPMLLPLAVVILITTVLVMAVTGITAEQMMKKEEKHHD